MIKRLLYFSLAGLLVMAFGCADEDLAPVATFETLKIGAFPKLISLNTGEFDLADLQGSAYDMDIEFIDNAGGTDVAEYNLTVSFIDNNPGNGDDSTTPTLYKSFGPSDFSTGSEGNLGLNVRIPFTEIANFVGVAPADVRSGDRFRFRAEVVKTDGGVFNAQNSTPAITTSFQGIFNFDVVATCPLPDSDFSGAYKIEHVGELPSPVFGSTAFGANGQVVTLNTVSGSTTRRTFTFTYLVDRGGGSGGFSGSGSLDFACDQVFVLSGGFNGGAGCGGGNITVTQASEPSTFDLEDDSSFVMNLVDFGRDGGCGVAGFPITVRFVKQ